MIKYYKPIAVALALSICVFMNTPAFSQEEVSKITEGMNQGDFAMLLIKELGAEGLLPTAATINDAFALLEKLGIVPPKGWDEEATITKEMLGYMLGLSEGEIAGATFDELLSNLETKLANILWSMGIRSVAPQTISPTGG